MGSETISVIIVSYKHGETVPAALQSLRLLGSCLKEVWLVDNAGDLQRETWGDIQDLPVTLVESGSNIGFAAAVNRVAKEATGSYLMLLSPDAEILEFDAQGVFAQFASNAGAIGALTVDTDGKSSVSWGEFASFRWVLRQILGVRKLFDSRSLRLLQGGQAIEVEWALGAALIFSRTTFLSLGEFDEAYRVAGEDQDFGRRLQHKELRTLISPSWVVRHVPRDIQGRQFRKGVRRNNFRFLSRHGNVAERFAARLVVGG